MGDDKGPFTLSGSGEPGGIWWIRGFGKAWGPPWSDGAAADHEVAMFNAAYQRGVKEERERILDAIRNIALYGDQRTALVAVVRGETPPAPAPAAPTPEDATKEETCEGCKYAHGRKVPVSSSYPCESCRRFPTAEILDYYTQEKPVPATVKGESQ